MSMKDYLELRDEIVAEILELEPEYAKVMKKMGSFDEVMPVVSRMDYLERYLKKVCKHMQKECGKECGHLCAMCGGQK